MKRRSFLQFLGMSPAVAVVPAAANAVEKFEQTAKALDIMPTPATPRGYMSQDFSACSVPAYVDYGSFNQSLVSRKTITIK